MNSLPNHLFRGSVLVLLTVNLHAQSVEDSQRRIADSMERMEVAQRNRDQSVTVRVRKVAPESNNSVAPTWVAPHFGIGGQLLNAHEIPMEYWPKVARGMGRSVEQVFGHLYLPTKQRGLSQEEVAEKQAQLDQVQAQLAAAEAELRKRQRQLNQTPQPHPQSAEEFPPVKLDVESVKISGPDSKEFALAVAESVRRARKKYPDIAADPKVLSDLNAFTHACMQMAENKTAFATNPNWPEEVADLYFRQSENQQN